MFAEKLPDMKNLYLLAVCLCLFALPACEKISDEETTTTIDDTKTDNDDSQGSGDQGGSGTGDETGGGSNTGGDTGGSTGGDTGGNTGSGVDSDDDDTYWSNDSTYYPDGDDPYNESGFVDGNEKGNTGGSTSGGTGSGSDSGSGSGSGSTSGDYSYDYTVQGEKAYSVSQFVSQYFDGMVWVVGYVVGDCTESISNANFEPPFTQPQAVLLADNPKESNPANVIAIQLNGSSRRARYSLQSNSDKHRKNRLAVLGYKTTYLNVYGMKAGKAAGIGAIQWYD